MSRSYIIRRRQNKILYFETVLTSCIITFFIWKQTGHPWVFSIIVFPIFMFGFIYAFFNFRFFRYILTVIYSILYGLIAYLIGRSIDEHMFITGVVLAFVVYFISIWLHIEHFDFLKKAKIVEIERN